MSLATGLGGNYNSLAGFSALAGFGDGSAMPLSLGSTSLMPSGTPDVMAGLPSLGTIGGGGGAGVLGPAGAVISGLQALGSLWMAHKQLKLAKKQFKFTKDMTNINLNNQMQSYNTALADRARSRGVMEGQSPDQVGQYIASNSLSRNQGLNNGYKVGDVSAAALNNYSSYLGRGTSGYSGPSSSGSTSSAPAPASPSSRDDDKNG